MWFYWICPKFKSILTATQYVQTVVLTLIVDLVEQPPNRMHRIGAGTKELDLHILYVVWEAEASNIHCVAPQFSFCRQCGNTEPFRISIIFQLFLAMKMWDTVMFPPWGKYWFDHFDLSGNGRQTLITYIFSWFWTVSCPTFLTNEGMTFPLSSNIRIASFPTFPRHGSKACTCAVGPWYKVLVQEFLWPCLKMVT